MAILILDFIAAITTNNTTVINAHPYATHFHACKYSSSAAKYAEEAGRRREGEDERERETRERENEIKGDIEKLIVVLVQAFK